MNRMPWEILFSAVMAMCAVGCVGGGYVTGNVRDGIPQYSNERQVAPPNVKVAIYPVSDAGDPEMRMMREKGRELLAEQMKSAGYLIVSSSFADASSRDAGIVELLDSHNMTEWGDDGVASLVTVVVVRVRRPGVLTDGRIACGRVRSFQGVFRCKLGRRPHDFSLSDTERAEGIRGAVANIMRIAQFKEAVEASNGGL